MGNGAGLTDCWDSYSIFAMQGLSRVTKVYTNNIGFIARSFLQLWQFQSE
jgi:hypothetical protein